MPETTVSHEDLEDLLKEAVAQDDRIQALRTRVRELESANALLQEELTKSADRAPEVHVYLPDQIKTIAAATETILERGSDGLAARSITRPTEAA